MSRAVSFMQQVATGKLVAGVLLIGLTLVLTDCSSEEGPVDLSVHVGIDPVAYFVGRIAEGAPVSIATILPPGKSPAIYDPSPKDMAALSGASVYFLTGLPFEEKLTQKMARLFPDLEIFDTREGITLRMMDEDHPEDTGAHIHYGGRDPHFWLNPQLVKIQCRNICEKLMALDANRADLFEKNLHYLMADIESVDSTVAVMLAPVEGNAIYVFHPAFGYFAKRYGLRQVAIEMAGKEPGARHLGQLVENARQEGIAAIIVQKEFSTGPAEAIAREIGAKVIVVNPLAYDYLSNFVELAESIRSAMAEKN